MGHLSTYETHQNHNIGTTKKLLVVLSVWNFLDQFGRGYFMASKYGECTDVVHSKYGVQKLPTCTWMNPPNSLCASLDTSIA